MSPRRKPPGLRRALRKSEYGSRKAARVDLSGFDAFQADLDEAYLAARLAMAEEILEESQRTVPVFTGALKRTGRIEESREGVAVVYGDDERVWYADATERTKPYLRPAAMRRRPILDAAAGAAREALE